MAPEESHLQGQEIDGGRGAADRDGAVVSHGDRASVWEDEKVLDTDGVSVIQHCECTNAPHRSSEMVKTVCFTYSCTCMWRITLT